FGITLSIRYRRCLLYMIANSSIIERSIPASKYRTNITLALFWDYARTPYYYPDVVSRDTQCELAVNETNADPDILPNTYVNIVRFNSWDPKLAKSRGVRSGGHAAVQAIAAANSGAMGVIGELFDRTTVYAAEVFSQYKMPYCGATQGIDKLSDKNLFEYFFRVHSSGRILGPAILSLLQHWEVKRVAIVVDTSLDFQAFARSLEHVLMGTSVKLIQRLTILANMVHQSDYSQIYQQLKAVDARYIVIFTQAPYVADIYFHARNYSLVGEKYVWISPTPPDASSGDLVGQYGESAPDDMEGFVMITQDSPDFNSDAVTNFVNTWFPLSDSDPERFPPIYDTETAGAYDCVKLMLLGIHEFMDKNPQYTPEMLANGTLTSQFTPDKFANTGYNGVVYQPITLTANGDLNIPIVFFTLNYTLYSDPDLAWDRTTAFGATNLNGTQFIPLPTKPEFYGDLLVQQLIHKAPEYHHQMDP
ncbi:hypothetical protein HDU76_007802, partial [Blyttiomyces sp. JEL0837]